jgi:hypothetical protein
MPLESQLLCAAGGADVEVLRAGKKRLAATFEVSKHPLKKIKFITCSDCVLRLRECLRFLRSAQFIRASLAVRRTCCLR